MAQFALSSLLGILSNGNRAISTVGGRATAEITNVALAASAVYTQAWQDSQANGATYVGGSVVADQAGTLYVDFADDQTYPLDSVEALSFTPATAGTPNASKLSYAVHITTRYYRFRYVNGATAQGTFELFQTPLHTAPQSVSLFGSLPEPRLGAWTTIYTVTAANMPAGGGSNYPSVESVLTPGATKRYFDISNSLNQAWTLTMFVCDSTGLGGENYPGNSAPSAINIATNEVHVFLDSDSYPQLRSLGDSLKLTITSGATQATTGQFSIDVREAFN